jgi:lambda family phage portal protein
MARRARLENPSLNQAFQELRNDFSAAKANRYRRRRTGIPLSGSNADYHYRSDSDYLRMMEYARDMFRNDMVVGQGVRRVVDNVVRDGFTLDSQTGDRRVDKAILDRWREWSETPEQCDVMGEMAFSDMEAQVCQAPIVDGDIWPVLTDDGSIQMFEAHRVRTPANAANRKNPPIHGVVMDQYRRRMEILVTKEDLNPLSPLTRVDDVMAYPIRDSRGHRVVLQIYRSDRVTQTRGVTHFAPIFDTIGIHDDVQFAKLVQQQIVSCFAIFREQSADAPGVPGAQEGARQSETRSDGTMRTIEGIAPGMDIEGRPGEKLHGFSPNVPNPEFFTHATLILTFIAVNLGIPVAVLLLDPRETNFSGWRGAIDQARIGFRRFQRLLCRRFHRPVYLWKLRQWASEDPFFRSAKERLGPLFERHQWYPPGWDYIEPMKDAGADLIRVRNCLISQRRRCAERGVEWDVLGREIVEDNARFIARAHRMAQRLNKKYPDLGITWREVASLPTPDGVSVKIAPEADRGVQGRPSEQETRDEE